MRNVTRIGRDNEESQNMKLCIFAFRGCLLWALTMFCIYHGVMYTQKEKYVCWVTFCHIETEIICPGVKAKLEVGGERVLQNNQGLYLSPFKANMHVSLHIWIFTGAFSSVSKPCQSRSKNAMHNIRQNLAPFGMFLFWTAARGSTNFISMFLQLFHLLCKMQSVNGT